MLTSFLGGEKQRDLWLAEMLLYVYYCNVVMNDKVYGIILILLIVLGHLPIGMFSQFVTGFWKDVIVLVVGILLVMR